MANDAFFDKVVVITGGGSGIGRACALAFSAQGAKVIVVGRKREPLERTAYGSPNIFVEVADIGLERDCRRVLDEVEKREGRIDVLVNNAGIFQAHSLQDTTEANLADVFSTNIFGPILLTKAAASALAKTHGTVVNVSSTVGHKASPGVVAYAASKAALEHATRCLALELAPLGIRVNALAPGPTETPVLQNAGIPTEVVEAIRKREVRQVPLGRLGNAEEVAAGILYLAGAETSWMTGQVVAMDGGLSLGVSGKEPEVGFLYSGRRSRTTKSRCSGKGQ